MMGDNDVVITPRLPAFPKLTSWQVILGIDLITKSYRVAFMAKQQPSMADARYSGQLNEVPGEVSGGSAAPARRHANERPEAPIADQQQQPED